PVEAPDGTIADEVVPSSRTTEASTVGLPRESNTSWALILTISMEFSFTFPENAPFRNAAPSCRGASETSLWDILETYEAVRKLARRDHRVSNSTTSPLRIVENCVSSRRALSAYEFSHSSCFLMITIPWIFDSAGSACSSNYRE